MRTPPLASRSFATATVKLPFHPDLQRKLMMSFRKRNIGISSNSSRSPSSSISHLGDDKVISSATSTKPLAPTPGIRPSPLDGRPTTSTGTPSLDAVLAGHAGLALGNSLLIEELGTTDYAGALLRYYAAEGLVQGHMVHVVGVGEQWGRELPGLVGAADTHNETDSANKEKKGRMKIAWRYERLGEFGSGAAGPRGGIALPLILAACVHSQHLIIHSRSAQTASILWDTDGHRRSINARQDSSAADNLQRHFKLKLERTLKFLPHLRLS